LSETESIALIRMLEKREQYVHRGAAYEAHGAGTMILLLWNTLTEFRDTLPTGWDDL
jgi:hypothetical protein